MGKHGPCYHCGVTSTPLWRNGPPEKPILCNACGSRWRTKGTLVNYTPLHSRPEPDEFEDYRVSKVNKPLPFVKNKAKVFKRKYDSNFTEFAPVHPDYYRKGFDEDTSNKSSSGSAISNSESCAQYGSADASDLTVGPSQPVIWDSTVPSRKRTCVTRPKPSPVEKLTKDLYTIWHEQQSSCFSATSEEELLLESDKPMVSVEIGHGSVLIRHPSSIAREEESEASSFSIDNKRNSLISKPAIHIGDTSGNLLIRGIDKMKKPANIGAEQERIRRDKDQLEKLQILAHHKSPLCHIDLQEILNFDKFASHLTNDEQQQLLKLLPSVDTLEAPVSLRSMFECPQFKENLFSFQKLLENGLFDNSLSGVKTDDCRVLKKLVLCNLTKSKWVEQYKTFKGLKGKSVTSESEVAGESNALAAVSSLGVKRPQGGPHFSGANAIRNFPKKTISYDQKESMDKGRSFFTPKSFISSHNYDYSSQFGDESCEQDLLLNVPSNGSFPQAELLVETSSFGGQASTSSSSVYPYFVHP